jgi:glutathione synthase/RimK-type ligase-like ATP-grasp enzyme
MKIAYLHRLTFDESEQRFLDEAKQLGIELVLIKYKQLRMVDGKILFGEMDMKDFDGWFFRSVGSELEWSKLLQLYARKHNIPVVDEYLLTEGPLRRFKSVMTWQLMEAGVKYPQSSYIETWNDLESFLKEATFPLIVKLSQGGRHGMGTFWIREYADLNKLKEILEVRKLKAKEKGEKIPLIRGFLVQEYIENDGDFRVMTVGYKCIGGFKRQVKEEKLILNKSQGNSVGLKEIPKEVIKTAEAAARALQVEVAGTDLVISKKTGEVYIIEVNEAPQFKVFEKRTKINVPKMILEYCVEKFQSLSALPRLPLTREKNSFDI